jgi:hypothetical protein
LNETHRATSDAPFPAPFPELNAVLVRLLSEAQTTLGDEFVGLYIHGSLALGAFSMETSDVDFVVVTEHELTSELLRAVEVMHTRIAASGLRWARKLEGSYIPREAIRKYDPARSYHPALRVDGSFGIDHHSRDWIIQRHVIREHGVVMAGPSPRDLIDEVSPDQLRQSTLGTLLDWWAPMVDDPGRLQSAEYQAFAVLTMCRVLYTLEFGTVGSKYQAAHWAQDTLGEQWAELINHALAWRHDTAFDSMPGVVSFIRFALDRVQQTLARQG